MFWLIDTVQVLETAITVMNAPCGRLQLEDCREPRKASRDNLSDSIAQTLLAIMLRAVGAAIIFTVSLHAMTNNFAAAMCAAGGAGLNGALETIEIPGLGLHLYLKSFVIFISAYVTASHNSIPQFEREECLITGRSLLPDCAQPGQMAQKRRHSFCKNYLIATRSALSLRSFSVAAGISNLSSWLACR